MSVQDELTPSYAEDARIDVSLASPLSPIFPRRPCRLQIDSTRCAPYGLQLPIEIIVTGPRGEQDFARVVLRRTIPRSFTFSPKGAGRYTVVVREAAHNRWYGSLDVVVLGDRAQDPEP